MRTVGFVVFACSSLFVIEFLSFVSCAVNSIPCNELFDENVIQRSINNHLTRINMSSGNIGPSKWIVHTNNTQLTLKVKEPKGWIKMRLNDPIVSCSRGFLVTSVKLKGTMGSPNISIEIDLHIPEFTIRTMTFSLKGQWNGFDLAETSRFSITYKNMTVRIPMSMKLEKRNGEFHWQLVELNIDDTAIKQTYALHALKSLPDDIDLRRINDQLKSQVSSLIIRHKLRTFVDDLLDKCSRKLPMFGQL